MALKYLDSRSWADITREERFYCQHLFNLIKKHGLTDFISFVNQKLNASLPTDCHWEPAFEACFYRDFFLSKGQSNPYSPKRTFDLCLFSDDAILIIEAKAQQRFKSNDLETYARDPERVQKVTGVSQVVLVGLASSNYHPSEDTRAIFFNNTLLTWRQLAEYYEQDQTLLRADSLYCPSPIEYGG